MRKEFKTKLVGRGKSGDVADVVVPFDVKRVWGSARIPVKGTIDGAKFRTTVVRMGGEYCFCVNQQMRAAAGGVGPGDTVKVTTEPDTAPRIVAAPPDLKKALKSNPTAQAAWDRYPYTHRKEFAQWISDAKKPETRDAAWKSQLPCWPPDAISRALELAPRQRVAFRSGRFLRG